MTQQIIDNGTTAGDGTGDDLFTAFQKCIDNFADLYARSAAKVLITETVTSSTAANVNFTSIPATYRDLEIRIRGRGAKAAVSLVDMRLQFNADTGANYDGQSLQAHGTTVVAFENLAQTNVYVGNIAAASSPSNAGDLVIIDVFDYRGTTFQKEGAYRNSLKRATTTGNVYQETGTFWWRNTAAITSVLVFPSSGGFVDGTVVSLYGSF